MTTEERATGRHSSRLEKHSLALIQWQYLVKQAGTMDLARERLNIVVTTGAS